MAEIKMGQEVRDRITGFQGIVVSITDFLNGCRRMGVQKKFDLKKDEKVADPEMFDELDLSIVGRGILPEPEDKHGDLGFRPMRTR